MYFWWIFNFFPIKTGNGHSTTGIQIIRQFYVFFSGTGNFETRSPDPDPTILKVLDPDPPYMNADPPIPGANKKVHTLLYMYPVQREGRAARGCQVWYGNRIISTVQTLNGKCSLEDCRYNIEFKHCAHFSFVTVAQQGITCASLNLFHPRNFCSLIRTKSIVTDRDTELKREKTK